MRHETDHALQAEERMRDDLWSSAAGLGRMGHMGQVNMGGRLDTCNMRE